MVFRKDSYKVNKSSIPLENVVQDSSVIHLPIYQKDDKKNCTCVQKMYAAALASLIMAVAMGFATGWSAPATYDMSTNPESPVEPSESEVAWIGSTLALGAMAGGVFAGPLADKIGRKDILILNVVPFIAGWLLISFAKSVAFVITGRLFCGVACGVISVTVPMYCVEIATPEVRGLLGSAYQGFLVIGSMMSAVFGSYVSWVHLSLIAALCATIGLILFSTMPETPRWLLAKDRLDDAIIVMQNLQGPSVNAEEECKTIYKDLENQPKGSLTLKEFKHPTVYKPALLSVAIMFFQQFSGSNAVLYYTSSIFEVSKEFLNPKNSTIILGAVQVVATLLGNLVVDRAGRKILLIISGSLMAISHGALGAYYYISNNNTLGIEKYNWAPLISLMIFVIAFSIGYGSVPWLLAPEMVPVRARSIVSGIATIANGLFAFVVTKTFSDLNTAIGTHFTFWSYSIISVLGVIFTAFLVPETKGKKLEEISKLFAGS